MKTESIVKYLKELRTIYLVNLVIFFIFCASAHFFVRGFHYICLGIILLMFLNLQYNYFKYKKYEEQTQELSYMRRN
jgi:hypothetical protein